MSPLFLPTAMPWLSDYQLASLMHIHMCVSICVFKQSLWWGALVLRWSAVGCHLLHDIFRGAACQHCSVHPLTSQPETKLSGHHYRTHISKALCNSYRPFAAMQLQGYPPPWWTAEELVLCTRLLCILVDKYIQCVFWSQKCNSEQHSFPLPCFMCIFEVKKKKTKTPSWQK